jgi:hypothetical protein
VEERRPLRRQRDDHHFGSLLMLAATAGAFLLVTWIATKGLLFFLQESTIRCKPQLKSFLALTRQQAQKHVCERAGKSGKQIERCVIASFHVAESMGFKGEFRQWEYLLRIGD